MQTAVETWELFTLSNCESLHHRIQWYPLFSDVTFAQSFSVNSPSKTNVTFELSLIPSKKF